MAGRGPSPKAAQLRRRRNVAAEFTPLPAQGRDGPIPELPGADALLESTRAWWDALWHSPMATQYIELDRYGLAMLARMIDMEARGDATAALRREIRLWEDRFGLSAAGRRSLRWHIVEPREATVDSPRTQSDPRRLAARDPRFGLGRDTTGESDERRPGKSTVCQ